VGALLDTAPWLDGLTDDQVSAVEHRGPPLLVAAGAGSGKTRVLAARTASLLADGHAPERLLLLTFTRRAAAELLGRAGGMVPDLGARRIGGGTFHALAVRLLRLHGGELGLSPDFAVLDRPDAVDLMGIVRVETGLAEAHERAPSPATLVDVLSRCVIAGEPLDEVLRTRFPWVARHRDDIARCFDAFTAAKRRADVLDLDDLQLHLRALLSDPRVGSAIGADLDHVLVDEVQDVDPVQLDVLRLLTANGAELTAVGDELQAIYGFRAGDGRGIRRLHERFDDLTTVHLSRSFRCPASVLAVANGIGLEAAPDRPPLVDDDRAGPPPTLTTCLDPGDEAALVVDRVLGAREQGTPLQQQVVLFRTGHHADRLELELARRDVPYRKFGGLRYLDTAHVRDLVAVLRLLDAPHDQVAWQRTLRSLRGVGPVGARRAATALGVGDSTTTPGPVARLLAGTELPGDPDDVAALRRALAPRRARSGTRSPRP
jgi:DNA helicase II / ATP-dependent DNA helicase PcrA